MWAKGRYIFLLLLLSSLDVVSQDSTPFINLEAGIDGIGSNLMSLLIPFDQGHVKSVEPF